MKNFKVAIDGPAGSGKSTISKKIAAQLNFSHIDTGAMYRAVTLHAMNLGIDLSDEKNYDFLDEIEVLYLNNKILLNGIDVSKEIRDPEVTSKVSLVSSLKIVRDKMVDLQKKAASQGLVIMDGRDIGYNVLPDADLKIFLTASIECRALRRHKELPGSNLQELKEDLVKRDYADSNRKESPLKKADDALLLDTTNMTIDEVISYIICLILERMN